jgi:hypothetical protein
VKKSYRIAGRKIYDLSFVVRSGTEEDQVGLRCRPFIWTEQSSPTNLVVIPSFGWIQMWGSLEKYELLKQAAEMTDNLQKSTATRDVRQFEEFLSVESALKHYEDRLQEELTTWKASDNQGLEMKWVEKDYQSVEVNDFHAAILQRSHVDDAYCMWQEQPIALEPTAETLVSMISDLGVSPSNERLYLYPVIRTGSASNDRHNLHTFAIPFELRDSRGSWVAKYRAGGMLAAQDTLLFPNLTTATAVDEVRLMIEKFSSLEVDVRNAAESFSQVSAMKVLPEGIESPPAENSLT